jgi:nucleoside-diphosphate-sugar epimerase
VRELAAQGRRVHAVNRSGRADVPAGVETVKGDATDAGDYVLPPLLGGKRAMWIGSLDMPHTLSLLPDFARGLITLGERDEALGQVWHIPTDAPLTGRQYFQMVCEQAGTKPNFGVYTRPAMMLVALFSPLVREVLEELYQFEALFVMSGDKYTRAFAVKFTPHREAIKQTVDWYIQHQMRSR